MNCKHCRQPITTRHRVDTCITCEILARGRAGGKNLDAYARELAEIHQAIDEGTASQRDEEFFWEQYRAELTPDEHAAVMSIAFDAVACAQCGRKRIAEDRYVSDGHFFCEYDRAYDSCERKWNVEREEAYRYV